MDIQYFRREVAFHTFLDGTGILDAVDTFHSTKEYLASFINSVRTPRLAQPRDSSEYLFAFGGWSTGTPVSSIAVYVPCFQVWLNLESELPQPWAYMGGAYHDVRISLNFIDLEGRWIFYIFFILFCSGFSLFMWWTPC